MPSKLPRVRMVAVAGLAALSFGGVAAAAGLAPVAAERATQAAASTAGGVAFGGYAICGAHGCPSILVRAPTCPRVWTATPTTPSTSDG